MITKHWFQKIVLLIVIFLVHEQSTVAKDNLIDIHSELNRYYDLQQPPFSIFVQIPGNSQFQSKNYHPKRCSHTDPGKSIQKFMSDAYKKQSGGEQILVGTPCLFSDSLGNWLSNYFETILCARTAGLHYVAVAKIWDPAVNDTASPFLANLPSIIKHDKPVGELAAKTNLAEKCTCMSLCHEQQNALWTKPQSRGVIGSLMWGALHSHLAQVSALKHGNSTVISSSDLSNRPAGTVLPLIPDAAVHYRCGDNFIGHYGFLPFSAFRKHIPAEAATIYVLAERRSRKTSTKQHRAAKCDAIFQGLFEFLTSQFPRSAVVIRRGDDLYTDLLRLAGAKTTICSVSSFCLWPAYVNDQPGHQVLSAMPLSIWGLNGSLSLRYYWVRHMSICPQWIL